MFRKLILGLTMLMCIGQAFAQNTLRFKKGLFKIVQITDLHYKLGVKASEQGLACVREMVQTEKPDLVRLFVRCPKGALYSRR